MSRRRVVITGLGCVTSLGQKSDEFFDALCSMKSGVSLIESFDVSNYPVRIGGEIKDFDIRDHIGHREGKRMDRFTQFSIVSSIRAVEDSGIDFSDEQLALRTGVFIGTGIGGIKEIEEQHIRLLQKGPSKVSPFCVPKLMGNAASGGVSIHFGLKGPNMCIVTACAAAGHAMGEAFNQVAYGRADVMVTGGTEAALTPIGLASFCSLKSLSTRNDDPQTASRPFDQDRDGFILSEGAGTVILEEYEHAKKRGAKIYAELLGYGATGDAYHITAPLPDGRGAARGLKIALEDAGVNPDQVDYINTHGTSTELNDIAETMAIRSVLGEDTKVAISSTKSCTGHMLGASGAVELVACCKAIEKSVIPPTANTKKIDKRCGPDMNHVIGGARDADIKVAVSNSLGFGGHNVSLVLGKV